MTCWLHYKLLSCLLTWNFPFLNSIFTVSFCSSPFFSLSHSSLNLFSSSFLVVSRSLRLLISSFLLYYCFSLTLFSHPLSHIQYVVLLTIPSLIWLFSPFLLVPLSFFNILILSYSSFSQHPRFSSSSSLIIFFSHSLLLSFFSSLILVVFLYLSSFLIVFPVLLLCQFLLSTSSPVIPLFAFSHGVLLFFLLLFPSFILVLVFSSLHLVLSHSLLFSLPSPCLLDGFLVSVSFFKICLFSQYRNYLLLELFSSLFLSFLLLSSFAFSSLVGPFFSQTRLLSFFSFSFFLSSCFLKSGPSFFVFSFSVWVPFLFSCLSFSIVSSSACLYFLSSTFVWSTCFLTVSC